MTAHSVGHPASIGWRFIVVLPLLLFACTKQNPKSCRDGVCNDPSLPYCDVGGELSGTPFTCVAGDCTPNRLNGLTPDAGFGSVAGGGAGGGILLEAPIVALGSEARLLANGGATTAGGMFTPVQPSLTTQPAQGGTCTSSASFHCSNGGNGAAADGPATDGGTVTYTNSPTVTEFQAGAGGGGLGYIRINAADGSFTEASNTIKSGAVSAAALKTR